jgi:hypothetical protein
LTDADQAAAGIHKLLKNQRACAAALTAALEKYPSLQSQYCLKKVDEIIEADFSMEAAKRTLRMYMGRGFSHTGPVFGLWFKGVFGVMLKKTVKFVDLLASAGYELDNVRIVPVTRSVAAPATVPPSPRRTVPGPMPLHPHAAAAADAALLPALLSHAPVVPRLALPPHTPLQDEGTALARPKHIVRGDGSDVAMVQSAPEPVAPIVQQVPVVAASAPDAERTQPLPGTLLPVSPADVMPDLASWLAKISALSPVAAAAQTEATSAPPAAPVPDPAPALASSAVSGPSEAEDARLDASVHVVVVRPQPPPKPCAPPPPPPPRPSVSPPPPPPLQKARLLV